MIQNKTKTKTTNKTKQKQNHATKKFLFSVYSLNQIRSLCKLHSPGIIFFWGGPAPLTSKKKKRKEKKKRKRKERERENATECKFTSQPTPHRPTPSLHETMKVIGICHLN